MKVSIYLTVGLVILSGLSGVAFGYYLTPEYKTTMYNKYSMDLGPADRTFDLRYINTMIAHHRGAVLLAEQLSKQTTRSEMQTLADNIINDEAKAIAELYSWKAEWYKDRKTVRDPIVANLGKADETFDLRFLNALIAHHEEGIIMTQETRRKSSRSEILNNADVVENFLKNSLETLINLRRNWYNL